jgi:hypothetical protein
MDTPRKAFPGSFGSFDGGGPLSRCVLLPVVQPETTIKAAKQTVIIFFTFQPPAPDMISFVQS